MTFFFFEISIDVVLKSGETPPGICTTRYGWGGKQLSSTVALPGFCDCGFGSGCCEINIFHPRKNQEPKTLKLSPNEIIKQEQYNNHLRKISELRGYMSVFGAPFMLYPC